MVNQLGGEWCSGDFKDIATGEIHSKICLQIDTLGKMIQFNGGQIGKRNQMPYIATGIVISGAEEYQVTLGTVLVAGVNVAKTTKFTCSSSALTMYSEKPLSMRVSFTRRPPAIGRPDWSDTYLALITSLTSRPSCPSLRMT
jgi:hypothetical protein